MIDLKDICQKNKIIPVAVFSTTDQAARTAELLLKYDLNILEITARTKEAFECIAFIAKQFPEITIGAGSITTNQQLQQAVDSGACFSVCPSYDPELVDLAIELDTAFVPGIATPSELHQAIKKSSIIKLFPAEKLGGVAYLNAITAPYALFDFHIIPTGGVTNNNAADYLHSKRVIACGMTYIVDSKLIQENKFDILNLRLKETKEML